MSLEIVYGEAKNIVATNELLNTLKMINLKGTLYVGYPIIASSDEILTIDALFLEKERFIVFHIPISEDIDLPSSKNGKESLKDIQDKIYYAISNNLGRHTNLRKGRELAIKINIVSFYPDFNESESEGENLLIATKNNLKDIIDNCNKTEAEFLPSLIAAIQRVTTIKPIKKRENLEKPDSKGSILKEIEKEIANLDKWQRQAAIETPDGPQRVRGLAGSGKTIVLALKAAYLHTNHPDWNIAVTFNTRSLYQQFKDLIRRFTFEHSNDEPNWQKLKIRHAWGSINQPGLYSEIASAVDYPVRDFIYGKEKYGAKIAFDGVCREFLEYIDNKEVTPLFDAVLVDEAQDLPDSFFMLVLNFLSGNKRFIYAYDELQNLSDYTMLSVSDLFGQNHAGKPNVTLTNTENEAHQDIILPICYRNTKWALALAHSLGFGIYRQEGLVQHFDDNSLWLDIGYEVIDGNLSDNSEVTLRRKASTHPKFFENLMSAKDSIDLKCFDNFNEEINWIAEQIILNIKDDELDADDILIILPDPITAKSKANIIRESLKKKGLNSHHAGVTSSVDEIFINNSIAIANIYRAKGNEAPMVYVVNCDYCASGFELIKLRNSLFTAITRSRAWLRLTGSGKKMISLITEFDKLKSIDFNLKFSLPDGEEKKRLRTIHRDRTVSEKAKIEKAQEGFTDFIEMLKKGDIAFDSLPPDIKKYLKKDNERTK